MPRYNTKQRETLLAYLSGHPDEQLTARQIATTLGEDVISISAVYRNLAALEQEGKLWRCVHDATNEITYQYIGSNECQNSLHLSCRVCGKRFHLAKEDADRLLAGAMEHTGFQIEMPESILYGICSTCRSA